MKVFDKDTLAMRVTHYKRPLSKYDEIGCFLLSRGPASEILDRHFCSVLHFKNDSQQGWILSMECGILYTKGLSHPACIRVILKLEPLLHCADVHDDKKDLIMYETPLRKQYFL